MDENTLLTNNHVINGAEWLTATTANGLKYDITQIIGRSENPDLALLHIDKAGVPLPLNTHGVHTGEAMCIIGAPMGTYPCISNGIVMNNTHQDGGVNYILSNVHSIGGNSGGPAFNRFGEVIGVVVGGMVDGPSSIDTIIQIDHLRDVDSQKQGTTKTYAEYVAEMNAPEENKYQILPLEEAQPGTLVRFGTYEQDNNFANGKEDILWLVEERNGDELTLLSLYCLDAVPFNESFDDVTWESSTIRAYLNSTFNEAAFTAEEQSRIMTTTIVNHLNPVYGTSCGSDIQDKVYLLSLEEVQRYWNISEDIEKIYDWLYGRATEYCISQPIWLEITDSSRCWWWLRSSSGESNRVCEVGSYGYFSFNGGPVDRTDHTIRPAIHVNAK